MAIDFTPSVDQLVELMNTTFLPPKIFDDTRLTFDVPSAVDAEDHDTEILATGIPGMGYFGSSTVKYNRIPLSLLDGLVSLASQAPFTIDLIVAMLNAQFGTFLTVEDLNDPDIPALTPGNSEVVTLTAASTSVGWLGSVDITINFGKPVLNAVVGKKALSTLEWTTYPIITFRDFMFNIDFSSARDSLAVTSVPMSGTTSGKGQDYADYSTLLDLCTKLGIPFFVQPSASNQLTDNATTDIADSNQNFDRVVIQTLAPGSRLLGPIYFHYNLFDKA